MNEKEKEGTRETIYEREGMLHTVTDVGVTSCQKIEAKL